jgi:eukaryotic-like serine/threonine-protein kinase
MQLWNDYEGRTVAGSYPLGKLLRPEGRSAFFSTSNGTGTPSVIRIIEAHFDESEILDRWKVISEIDQPNLLTMRRFGQTVLDGTPLVYAVMEAADLTLCDVLADRTLTVEETRELATSLIPAIEALHACDLVHEHIQPENIYAVGETIKLRSDCIREAASHLDEASPEIEARKAADVHDLVIVLLQALTGHRELKGSATLLPTPFDAIIRNGLSGTWGLKQMAAAINSSRIPAKPAPQAAPTSAPTPAPQEMEKIPAQQVLPVARKTEPAPATTERPRPQPAAQISTASQSSPIAAEPPSPVSKPEHVAAGTIAPDIRHRIVKPVEADPRRMRTWIAAAVGVLLLLLLFWFLTRSKPEPNTRPISTLATPEHPAAALPAKPSAISATPKPPVVAAATKPSAAIIPLAPSQSAPVQAASTGRTQWRVIAYTYNREDQAKQKAASLAGKAPGLNPEVFSPTGHAPYLVSLGGPMSRDQAGAVRSKAITAGLPHDTYIQNYTH